MALAISICILFLAFSCALVSCMERECRDQMKVIGDQVQTTGNVQSAILDAICDINLPSGICWTSILGMSMAYIERREADAYPDGLGTGCEATKNACAEQVNFVLRKLQNDRADNNGECVCRLFHAICTAGFPHSGACEQDMLRLIKDFNLHKMPMPSTPHRWKRDFWDTQCRFGKRLWPIRTPENDRAWMEGYNLWTSWAAPDEAKGGFVNRSVDG